MADALDDVVHAARFQPTHLAQLLHDLFPVDGGAPSPRLSVNATSQGTNSGVRGSRSATIPPVTRTGTGSIPGTGTGSVRRGLAASESFQAAEEVSLKPQTKWKGATAAALALAVGGFFVWKGVAKKKTDDEGARLTQSDPSKRFHIYVKSDPPGADIFVEGEATPIGETPVTIPIDLNGKSSVKLILRKDGYEDYDQRVINDVPLSINLKKHESAEAPKPAELAPPSAPGEGTSAPAVAPTGAAPSAADGADKAGHGHHHEHAKKPHKPAPSAPTPAADVDEN
jgi:hypothetical protein